MFLFLFGGGFQNWAKAVSNKGISLSGSLKLFGKEWCLVMYGNVPTPQGNGSRTVVWASSSLPLNEG